MTESVCPYCNNSIIPGSAYCDNCGRRLISVPPAQSQPTSVVKEEPPAQPPASSQHPEAATELQPPTGRICPHCSFNNVSGALFCAECGTALSFLPAPDDNPANIPTPELEPYPASPAPGVSYAAFITGSLVLQANQTILSLPQDRIELTIGREDPVSNIFPDIDLEQHGGHEAGVSRQHARLVMIDGQLCLVDLNSINGTYINRNKLNPGQPRPLRDGDEIRLGRFVLSYHAA